MTDKLRKAAQLLPCPFCGGEPERMKKSLDERFAYANEVTYWCKSCGCYRSARGDTSKPGYADNSTVEARALAAWNTRADMAQQDAQTVPQVALVPYTGDVVRIMREAGMTFHLGLPHKAVVEQMTRVVDLVYSEASIKSAQKFAAEPTTVIPEALVKWASSPELVETGNDWKQGYEHARAWVHVQLSLNNAAPTPPAQQDAQAVRQDWKLVPVEALSDHIADLRRCASMFRRRGMTATADETIKAADELEAMLNAAPTPPASRAVLTDEEVLDLWSPGLRRPALGVEKVKAFARAVIEAYEKKNGIK